MKRILPALCAAALLTMQTYAQQPSASEPTSPSAQPATPAQTSPSPAPGTQAAASAPRIAPGSIIPVQLVKTVDAKKAKTGDAVVAKVTEDLKNTSGVVIVPKNTQVMGHVTEAQARHKEHKKSELAIAFDKAVLTNGETMQMPMSIQAIIASPSQTANQNAQNSPSNPGYPGGSMPAGSPSLGMPGQSGGAQPSSQASMGGYGNAQMPTTPEPTDNNSTPKPQPQITANTKGVIGISNLTLAPPSNAQQGSLVTSEKNNVKLEGGTFLLLRVSP